jgi:TetR/AcrR family transcriptional regulator, hemagglutinin/protease regulatory protein
MPSKSPATSAAKKARRPARRRLAPEARRAELMSAALAVFARRGLGEARHAEIAAEAGASVPTVFVYFPTREALVEAVLAEVDSFFLDQARRVHAAAGPADTVLLGHIRAFAASVESSPSYARIWLDWSTAVRDEVWKRYLDFLDRMLAVVRGTLERGQREGTIAKGPDPDDQARLLVGSAHMLALMQFAGSPPDKLEHFFETLMSAVMGRPFATRASRTSRASRSR